MPNRRRDLYEERSSAQYSEDLLEEQRRRMKPRSVSTNVRPNYQSRQNLQEEQRLAREGQLQGAPESPTIAAMRQQAEAMQARSRVESEAQRLDFEFRKRMGRPSEPGSVSAFGGGGSQWASSTKGQLLGGGDELLRAYDLQTQGGMGRQGGGGVGRGRGLGAPPPSPQQQAQNWSDVNTAANAEIVPEGGQSSAAPVYNLFGRQHLDTAMISMGRDAIPQDVRTAYRAQTKEADTKLRLALAGRAGEFATLDEAKLFISSLGFDDRVGQHIDNRMVEHLSRSQPELYKQFIGEQKAESANESSYVQWTKQNDPSMVGATSDQILATRTPEQQFAFDQDINARHYEYDPTTGQPTLRPERKLTPIEEAQQEEKVVDATIAQAPDKLQKTWKGGKPKVESIEEVMEAKQIKQQAIDDKRYTAAEKSMERDRLIFEDKGGITQKELDTRNARNRAIMAEIDTRALAGGGVPATGGQPQAGGLPVMTAEEAAAVGPGVDFKTPDGRTMRTKGIPTAPAAVSPTRGIGTITSADGTVLATNAPATAPAVKPVAEAAPYVAPVVETPVPVAPVVTPTPEPEIEVSDEEVVQFLKGAVTGALGEVGSKISQGAETAAKLPGKALSKLFSLPYKAEQYIETLGVSGYNRLLEYGRQKVIEQKRKANK